MGSSQVLEDSSLTGTHLFQTGLGKKVPPFVKLQKFKKPIPWHRYGAEKNWAQLQEAAAGREPVDSSWGGYGCLIGMQEQTQLL
ncbi:hypothetical protein AMECASPLE_011293 [Ameca splendens]|uniref:Uncharacterized protein n=1 Tax=Ameca splendens TaxID=208324 RepID=A0ABV0ZAH2_9TELE